MTEDWTPRISAASEELVAYQELVELLNTSPIPDTEILANLGMFVPRSAFAKMQFMYMIYQKAIECHGVLMEFGTRWGRNAALFSTFRSMHEPWNESRKIVVFDTFEGFPSVDRQDGSEPEVRKGAYSVGVQYQETLRRILKAHESLAPRAHLPKSSVIVGDVGDTLPTYLKSHPETIIALAYFDLDLYSPTKKVLELIRPHLAKNSIVGFDELGYDRFPGETTALKEAWGITDIEICRVPWAPQQSYVQIC